MPITTAMNGNVSPLTCPGGGVNVPAWNALKSGSADNSIMALGPNATQQQLDDAVCAPPLVTLSVRDSALQIAAAYYGWHLTWNGLCPASPSSPQPWTSSQLTITPRSLGLVTVGMTIAQASAAAGEPLVVVGDGLSYPNGDSATGLSIQGQLVQCVGAFSRPGGPQVATPQGFRLGETLAQLKATYGSNLSYVPAPPGGGISPSPGYVVKFQDGNLAFLVTNGIVTTIMGGPGVLPSSLC